MAARDDPSQVAGGAVPVVGGGGPWSYPEAGQHPQEHCQDPHSALAQPCQTKPPGCLPTRQPGSAQQARVAANEWSCRRRRKEAEVWGDLWACNRIQAADWLRDALCGAHASTHPALSAPSSHLLPQPRLDGDCESQGPELLRLGWGGLEDVPPPKLSLSSQPSGGCYTRLHQIERRPWIKVLDEGDQGRARALGPPPREFPRLLGKGRPVPKLRFWSWLVEKFLAQLGDSDPGLPSPASWTPSTDTPSDNPPGLRDRGEPGLDSTEQG
jgi:hypothetical protein